MSLGRVECRCVRGLECGMHMSTKGTRCSLSRLVAAVAAVVAFALLAVPLGVAYAADSVVDTVNVNHVRTATMAASASEAGTLGPEKANDGSKEKASRWSSGTQAPAKDDKTFLSATFKAPTLIKRVEVTFENRDVVSSPATSRASNSSIRMRAAPSGRPLRLLVTRRAVLPVATLPRLPLILRALSPLRQFV